MSKREGLKTWDNLSDQQIAWVMRQLANHEAFAEMMKPINDIMEKETEGATLTGHEFSYIEMCRDHYDEQKHYDALEAKHYDSLDTPCCGGCYDGSPHDS